MKWTLRHWIQRHKTHIPTLWRCNLIVMGKMQFASITRGLRCTLHQKERILTSCSHYSTMARMSTNRTSLPDSVECGVEGRKARSRKVIDPARCRYKSSGRVWMESVAHGITIWTSRPGKKARSDRSPFEATSKLYLLHPSLLKILAYSTLSGWSSTAHHNHGRSRCAVGSDSESTR